MQRFCDLIFEDGRSEWRERAFRLLFRGFNFRGLPVNRENWIPQKFLAIQYACINIELHAIFGIYTCRYIMWLCQSIMNIDISH